MDQQVKGMHELNQAESLLVEQWDGMENGLRVEPLNTKRAANEVTIVHQGQVGSSELPSSDWLLAIDS